MLSYAVAGVGPGGAFALLGLALTITYRATRTVNFAVAATGAFGTLTFATLAAAGVPYWPAFLLGILTGAVLSAALGWVLVLWFEGSDVGTRSVVTIAQLIGLIAIASLIFGGNPKPVPTSFQGPAFTIGGTIVPQSAAVLIGLAVVVGVGVSLALSRTLAGKKLQAVSERAATAELLGIPARRYGLWVWAVTGAFSVLAITLISAAATTNFTSLSFTVVPALAAALFGLFRSLTWAVIGGIVLGVLQGMVAGTEQFAQFSTTAPFFALLVVLLVAQRGERWEDAR